MANNKISNQEEAPEIYFYNGECMCAEDVLTILSDEGYISVIWNEQKQIWEVSV